MLRKLILSVALAAGTLGAVASSADAASPIIQGYGHRHDHRGRFEILYRHRGHWDVYRTFHDREDAQRTAWHLRRQGYVVRIEHERGGHDRRW